MKDRDYMRLALVEAEKAAAEGEIPVGAVLVSSEGGIIASGHNLRETEHDATAHAEIIAIREGGRRLGDFRLTGATLYVTLEPCPMCAGAIAASRLRRLVYGAPDSRAGAVESVMAMFAEPALFAAGIEVAGGVMEDECRAVLQKFFCDRRRDL